MSGLFVHRTAAELLWGYEARAGGGNGGKACAALQLPARPALSAGAVGGPRERLPQCLHWPLVPACAHASRTRCPSASHALSSVPAYLLASHAHVRPQDPLLVRLKELLPPGKVPRTRIQLLPNMTDGAGEALARPASVYDTGVNDITNVWQVRLCLSLFFPSRALFSRDTTRRWGMGRTALEKGGVFWDAERESRGFV